MPVWLIALVVAGTAPIVVRLLANRFARQLEERTDKITAEIARRARKRAVASGAETREDGPAS
jgi:Zn-dependent protease with chaperone function